MGDNGEASDVKHGAPHIPFHRLPGEAGTRFDACTEGGGREDLNGWTFDAGTGGAVQTA